MRSRWLKEKLRKPKIERFQKLKIKRKIFAHDLKI